MLLVQAKDVVSLTGLTPNQVREWTERRKLVPPAISAHGSGTRNLFSWREVLLLRIAATLRAKFRVDLEDWRDLFRFLREHVEASSFPALWGKTILVRDTSHFDIVSQPLTTYVRSDFLVIGLDPHLEVLSRTFEPSSRAPQLSLPLLSVQR